MGVSSLKLALVIGLESEITSKRVQDCSGSTGRNAWGAESALTVVALPTYSQSHLDNKLLLLGLSGGGRR